MRRLLTVASLLVLVAVARPVLGGNPEIGFSDSLYVGGFDSPIAIAFLPGGNLLVAEKGGDLDLFDGTNTTNVVMAGGNPAAIPVCTGSEMGLLGVAVDPDFTNNGFIYLYRSIGADCGTDTGRTNQVIRVTMSNGTVDLNSLVVLLDGIHTDNGNHDGGVLRIGPDNLLYVGAGDSGNGDNQGGPGSSTNPYAQDLTSLNGKILRLNLDGTVPAGNPFVGMGGVRGEIWAYGFRNPFRMSFDTNGTLWIGDVGDETVEEIDIGHAGGNYSWPYCEGNLPTGCAAGGDIAPVFTYPHSGGTSLGGCLIGGAITGSAFGSRSGDYVFGDCDSETVYILTVNGTDDGFTGNAEMVSTGLGTPSDFVAGTDGSIYYVDFGAGQVRRLVAATAGVDELLSSKLLRLKDNTSNANAKSATIVSRDFSLDLGGGPTSTDDPAMHGGTLRIVSTAGGFDNTYPLPAGSWKYIGQPTQGKGYIYRDPKQVNGAVKNVVIRNGKKLKATGKGSGLGHSLATNPDPVSIVLQTGGKHYCMTLGSSNGTVTFHTGVSYVAKNATAPGACPP